MALFFPAILAIVFVCPLAFGGGTSGGGSPPAMQDALNALLSARESNIGQLYLNGEKLGLGVKGSLPSDLHVRRSATPMSLTVSGADFALMSERQGNIEALNTDGLLKSYKIEDGDSLDALILKDRRESIRAERKALDPVSTTIY
jgi:hypothetical protein